MRQRTLFDDELTFANRKMAEITFRGKLGLPIHRWYRLTPSFSPQLALDIATSFNLGENDFVLDPFSGVGTVPLCMKYQGIPACSVELNPYLLFVGTVKTKTYHEVGSIEATFRRFLGQFEAELKSLPPESQANRYLEEQFDWIPKISNPQRWWSPGNLMQLVCLRRLLASIEAKPLHLDLLKIGILGVLVPVSNAKHNHVSLTFAEHPLGMVDLLAVLSKMYEEILEDLRTVLGRPCSDVEVYHGDSKFLSRILPAGTRPSAIITSPPYPNRFSYARETRPHLFFFDFVEDAKAVGELESIAIGGTWGKATSILSGGIEPANEVVGSLLAPFIGKVGDGGRLMASYVIKYFNDIFAHAREVTAVCREQVRLAYVIGNSKFYGNPLPSDEILASIFGHFGFSLDRIERLRKRQSKVGLYEAVVFMRRG